MSFVAPGSITQEAILKDIEDYVRGQPDGAKWLDYFAASTGRTLLELMAGIGAFMSYQALAARRESNLLTAKLESSVRAIAFTLGYKINRRQAARIRLTVVPQSGVTGEYHIRRETPLGTLKGKPLYPVADKAIQASEEQTIDCVLGTWKIWPPATDPLFSEGYVRSSVDFASIEFIPSSIDVNYIDNELVEVHSLSGGGDRILALEDYLEEMKLASETPKVDDRGVVVRTGVDSLVVTFGSLAIGRRLKVNEPIRIHYVEVPTVEEENVLSPYVLADLAVTDSTLSESTRYSFTGLEVRRKERPHDDPIKIANVVPGYFSALHRMITQGDKQSIVRSRPEIYDARYGWPGLCSVSPAENSTADECRAAAVKLYAYNLLNRTRVDDETKDIKLDPKNTNPTGVWIGSNELWAADATAKKIFAYTLSSGVRATTTRTVVEERRDLDFGDVVSINPGGIWSDGTTMWVVDGKDSRIYAYRLSKDTQFRVNGRQTINGSDLDITVDGVGIALDSGTKIRIGDAEFTLNGAVAAGATSIVVASPSADTTVADTAEVFTVIAIRDPQKDFDTLIPAGNLQPYGIWCDNHPTEPTVWVSDLADDRLYAYALVSKDRKPTKDFEDLGFTGNNNPLDIWANSTTMWVADKEDKKVYGYTFDTKSHLGHRKSGVDFNTLQAAANTDPRGAWSDGTTMWVVDDGDNKLYAYNLSTKARDAGKDFNTLQAAGNTGPQGIWSDGTTMWVADSVTNKIYAYALRRDSGFRVNNRQTINGSDLDITVDGSGDAIADGTEIRIGENIFTVNGAVDAGASSIVVDAPSATIGLEDDAEVLVFSTTRDADKDLNDLDALNTDPRGIWSDGTTMWVIDSSVGATDDTDARIFAYDLESDPIGERVPGRDLIALAAAGNQSPRDIWSDGTTMWVSDDSDDSDDKLFAYSLRDRTRLPGKDITLPDDNANPWGIWSDGTTMWVVDDGDNKLYAYDMNPHDFDPLDSSNDSPTGIWSDGTTMWVIDNGVGKWTSSTETKCFATMSYILEVTRPGMPPGTPPGTPPDTPPDTILERLDPPGTPLTTSEETALLAFCDEHRILGETLEFRAGIPVYLDIRMAIILSASGTSLKDVTKYITTIVESFCYKLGNNFSTGQLVTMISELDEISGVYLQRPLTDKQLSWLGYFSLSPNGERGTNFTVTGLDITVVGSTRELNDFVNPAPTNTGYSLTPVPVA